MKKMKFIVALAASLSVVFFGIAMCMHSIKGAGAVAVWTMLGALALGAVINLLGFSQLMSKRVDKESKDSLCPPAHQTWPLWAFLASFIMIVCGGVLCGYLASNIWCVRDLANFELTAILSVIAIKKFQDLFRK